MAPPIWLGFALWGSRAARGSRRARPKPRVGRESDLRVGTSHEQKVRVTRGDHEKNYTYLVSFSIFSFKYDLKLTSLPELSWCRRTYWRAGTGMPTAIINSVVRNLTEVGQGAGNNSTRS
jgi:hypothetical protein